MKRFWSVLAGVVGVSSMLAGCNTPTAKSEMLVATNPVLASIVQQVVGDSMHVVSVIPNGKDPHEYQPSAGDIATLAHARVLVSSGYSFEPSLAKSVTAARSKGTPVFDVQWNMSGIDDPHWFTDPLMVGNVLAKLVPFLESALNASLDVPYARTVADLQSMVDEGRSAIAAAVKNSSVDCQVASEHVFLAPFESRFACAGSAVLNMGSRTPDAEPSASAIENFVTTIKDRKVPMILEDATETSKILEQVSAQTKVPIVKVNVHTMGDAVTYRGYIMKIVNSIAGAL